MRSASGETVDGYVHQLYFSYPSSGGIEAVIQGFIKRLNSKCTLLCEEKILELRKVKEGFEVVSNGRKIKADQVISTIPVQELGVIYNTPPEVTENISNLRYNSILIAFVKAAKDLCGNNFAFMNPEKDIIFHRISKMDFLGKNYQNSSGATYMVEVTYREKDYIDSLPEKVLKEKIAQGMKKIAFVEDEKDIEFINLTRHPYAYVIYDLNHKKNMNAIREYYCSQGIFLNGRFGNFEYWNMDRVIRESKKLVEERLSMR